jgi:hypothetical protein
LFQKLVISDIVPSEERFWLTRSAIFDASVGATDGAGARRLTARRFARRVNVMAFLMLSA